MCKYKIGDVLWGLAPFGAPDNEGTGGKLRPLVVLQVKDSPCKYFVVECSSLKPYHHQFPGILVRESHPNYPECGFLEDTKILTGSKGWIPEYLMKPHPTKGENPLGFCSFVNEIMEYIMGTKK